MPHDDNDNDNARVTTLALPVQSAGELKKPNRKAQPKLIKHKTLTICNNICPIS